MLRRTCVVSTYLIVFTLQTSSLNAQIRTDSVPRFELGGELASVVLLANDGGLVLGGGPRISLNLSRRDAVELLVDAVAGTEQSGLVGLYLVQYKRALREENRRYGGAFIIACAGGSFRYDHNPERRTERPDGSTVVQPAYTYAQLAGPFLLGTGIGVERVLSRYATFRAEAGVLVVSFAAVGIRGAVGISIPLGGYGGARR
jgi:hypothetical protein